MDPVRRALFLVLFASVFLTEPSHVRAAMSADRVSLPSAQTTMRLVRQLADTLASNVSAPADKPTFKRDLKPILAASQVAIVHPALEPHAFRLPPPTLNVTCEM